MQQEKLAVFIGRFQPFHKGHQAIADAAIAKYGNILFIVGSAYQARTSKNPFTYRERRDMIRALYPTAKIEAVQNFSNDEDWKERVNWNISWHANPENLPVVIVGSSVRDNASYLHWFPQYELDLSPDLNPGLSASMLRDSIYANLYNNNPAVEVLKYIPEAIQPILQGLCKSAAMVSCAAKACAQDEEKRKWAQTPYPPIFVCVDAVVRKDNHILLIKRKSNGLLALPGGHLDQHERLYDGAIRELREETELTLSDAQFKHYYKGMTTFDKPDRSEDRAFRVISHTSLFEIYDGTCFVLNPDGADDAILASMFDLSWIKANSELFHDDHWDIIRTLTNDFEEV